MSSTVAITDDSYEDTLKNSSGPGFLYVWATWCGPCRMVKPHFLHFADQYREQANFFEADLEKLERVAQNLRIMSTPTLLAYLDGEEIDRRHGALMRGQVEQWITQHLRL